MQEWTDSITEIGEEEQSIDSYSEIDLKELSTEPIEEIDQEMVVQSKSILQTSIGNKKIHRFFVKRAFECI